MISVQLLEKVKKIPPAYESEVESFIDAILEKKVDPPAMTSPKRVIGLLKGKMKMSPDFDDPLEEFKDYM
ncbi:type II toxin-antitoxin system VapB family antitoxin [Dyadobacter luticola]|uniref:DUF2281 domain-containing protein n=1 Tax=Dyadobacter luticola TaxID=1979387 RepID=A0A5R9L1C6_9BACT|nr:DUF2281 domain-containing protein [Dyadobacter luticola]TLV02155.1 DUF2281 domain-containing protein [Dyadobacter luticola]